MPMPTSPPAATTRAPVAAGVPWLRAALAGVLVLIAATGARAQAQTSAAAPPQSAALAQAASLTQQADTYLSQGRYAEAEPLYKQALEATQQDLGPDHPDVAASLNNLARLYTRAGRYAEAEPLYDRAIAIWEKALGPDHPEVAVGVGNLATLYEAQGRYAQAEPLYQRALAIDQKALAPDRPELATDLNNLAMLYDDQGRYADAEPLLKQAQAIDQKALGPNDPEVAKDLNNLGVLYEDQGRYQEVEPLLKRAQQIDEQALGPDDPQVATTLNNQALLDEDQGRYADAEPLYQRALAIRQKTFGPEHLEVATSLDNLAGLEWQQGRYADAEQLEKQALGIRERALGPDHPDVAIDLDNLAVLYGDQGRDTEAVGLEQRALTIRKQQLGSDDRSVAKSLDDIAGLYEDQGRFAEAEPLYTGSLAIRENTLGPEHPLVAVSLNDLGVLYRREGRDAEAEPLFKRALDIDRRALGPDHPEVATDLNNLALVYGDQDRYADAEPLLKQALAIREKTLGPDHPDVATSLNNLAGLYMHAQRYSDAEPLYQRALAIDQKTFGPNHPDIATAQRNLAVLYWQQGRYADAIPRFEQALTIREQAFGPDHPDVAEILVQLAQAKAAQGDNAGARQLFEQARQTILAVRRTNAGLGEANLQTLLKPLDSGLVQYVSLLATIARDQHLDTAQTPASNDAFAVAEQVRGGPAQTAMAQAGARAASGDPAIAALVRRVQDLSAQYQAVGKQLDVQYSAQQQDAALIKSLQQSSAQLAQSLKEASAELYGKFPKYAELVAPDPITIDETQRLLRPGEALISYFTLDDRVLGWLVQPGRAPTYRDVPVGKDTLSATIARIRASITPACNQEGADCRVPAFDVSDANQLYTLLLKPFAGALADTRRLIIVPDDRLLPVPFAALVTDSTGQAYTTLAADYAQGNSPSPKEFSDDYAQIPWMVNSAFAINELPSATALRMLRSGAGSAVVTAQAEPFLGIGDPALNGSNCGTERGASMPNMCGPYSVDALCPLPGAGPELVADADALGADRDTALFTGKDATRSTVINLNGTGRLGHARVIAFATHALTAGHVGACTEPALVLTPNRGQQESGLLSVQDILGFKLVHAEWVILSACNTGEAGTNGEGLSGLVRAFFYAGAPSLLVSQWSVDDAATRKLISSVLRYYAAHPDASRAEALQQGMRGLLTGDQKSGQAYFAHPFAWASFFIAGEGGPAAAP
jgi:tetratricopeptide (TPR) repeat protein